MENTANSVNNTKKNIDISKILKEHVFRDEKTIIGTAIIIFILISGALMLKEEFGKIADNFGLVNITKKYEKYNDRDYTDRMADEAGEGMYALVKGALAHENPKGAFQILREFWSRMRINDPENEDPEGWKLLQDIIKLAKQQGEALLPY